MDIESLPMKIICSVLLIVATWGVLSWLIELTYNIIWGI